LLSSIWLCASERRKKTGSFEVKDELLAKRNSTLVAVIRLCGVGFSFGIIVLLALQRLATEKF
jgi:hypothetical protein